MTYDSNGDGSEQSDGRLTGSRRRFLLGTAGAVGGLALGSAFTSSAVAEHIDYEEQFDDDVDLLNYALTLEHLEAEFYKEAFDNLGAGDIRNSDTLEDFDGPINDRVVGDLAMIRDHEVEHVEVLESTIEDLGGDPIEMPEFDFAGTTEDADEFLATARVLENTGVSAYAGAAPSIENADLVPPALSIHSVEARHASFLNVLQGRTGFPDAFDEARSRDEVLDIASDFIVDESDGDDGDDASDDDDDDSDDDDYDDDEAGDSDGSKDKDDE